MLRGFLYISLGFSIAVSFFIGCNMKEGGEGIQLNANTNRDGKTIQQRYALPSGFTRVAVDKGSFAAYLRELPLRDNDHLVKYYNGETKPKGDVYDAVIKMDIGKKNLLQCADAVIKLRAEYLYAQKNYSAIHFNFTNGFRAEYPKWKSGYRIVVAGNNVVWKKSAEPDESYSCFNQFMETVFTYAGTLSLSKELETKSLADMEIGDVFIKGGSPGHAVIVVDMMQNKTTGKKYFMLAQSYMPAQEIQVLLNPNAEESTVWYELDTNQSIWQTPEWKFTSDQLKAFVELE
jgi:hypothetical protein